MEDCLIDRVMGLQVCRETERANHPGCLPGLRSLFNTYWLFAATSLKHAEAPWRTSEQKVHCFPKWQKLPKFLGKLASINHACLNQAWFILVLNKLIFCGSGSQQLEIASLETDPHLLPQIAGFAWIHATWFISLCHKLHFLLQQNMLGYIMLGHLLYDY